MSARALVSTQKQSSSRVTPCISAVLQRKCACGTHTMTGECEDCKSKKGFLQRAALSPRGKGIEGEGVVPPIVDEVLRSPGQPLDAATRAFMEPRFGYDLAGMQVSRIGPSLIYRRFAIGQPCDHFEQEADRMSDRVPHVRARNAARRHDFSGVRIHTDEKAAEFARRVGALAYTVGQHLVFREGQYAPHTGQGKKLLAHELTHVVQQAHTGPSLQRLSYADLKEKAYTGLISGLRAAKKAALDTLRGQVSRLPKKWWGAANTIISICDEVLGVIETLILAVIGIVVGFGENAVGLVRGSLTLGYGIIKLLYDLVVGIFTNFDELKQDLNAIAEAFINLPSALKIMVTDWLDRFNKASLERQTLMIAELVGQIEALIASFGVAASRAGSVGTVAEAGGEAAAAGTGAAATEAAATGAQTARPALTLIRGGGEARATAAAFESRATAPAFEGSAALKVAPAIEEVPAAAPLRVVPPAPVAEAAAATAPEAAAAGGKALAPGVVAAAEAAGKRKKPMPLNTMRFQVQWGTGQGGPTFSRTEVAPANPGVTTIKAVEALWTVIRSVVPGAAQTAAQPAAVKQEAWIRTRPPAGVGPGTFSHSEYFRYLRYTDARVDVENLRGQNLRV